MLLESCYSVTKRQLLQQCQVHLKAHFLPPTHPPTLSHLYNVPGDLRAFVAQLSNVTLFYITSTFKVSLVNIRYSLTQKIVFPTFTFPAIFQEVNPGNSVDFEVLCHHFNGEDFAILTFNQISTEPIYTSIISGIDSLTFCD